MLVMLRLVGELTAALLRGLFTDRETLVLENLALRQQLAVWARRQQRPRLAAADRAFWIAPAGPHWLYPRIDEDHTITTMNARDTKSSNHISRVGALTTPPSSINPNSPTKDRFCPGTR